VVDPARVTTPVPVEPLLRIVIEFKNEVPPVWVKTPVPVSPTKRAVAVEVIPMFPPVMRIEPYDAVPAVTVPVPR
jgi:hypothetical protein